MSHIGTITHHRVPHIKGPWLQRIAMLAVGFALGAVAVLIVDSGGTEVDPAGPTAETATQQVANVTGMAHDDFVRLNTTDLDWMSPQTQTYVVTRPAAVDPFIHMNTTAYDGLVPADSATRIESQNTVDPDFLRWNTTSLEYPPRPYSDQPDGPQ